MLPSLVTASDNIDLPIGSSLTVTYKVTVKGPVVGGLTSVVNSASVTSDQQTLPLVSSTTHPLQSASIGDLVWNDIDGDGVQDAGEAGLAGVLVYIDLDGDGVHDPDEPSAVTDSNGNYLISGLAAGSYTVRTDLSTVPANWLPTYDLDGGKDSKTSVTLTNGEKRTDVDFGYKPLTVSGAVTADTDFNGTGDTPLSGISVSLYLDEDGDGIPDSETPVKTVLTGADGSYLFDSLPPGQYVVVEQNGAAYPKDVSDKDGSANGTNLNTIKVDLTHGISSTGNDFVDRAELGRIGDRIWFDFDGDGVQDPGEPGIANVTVELRSASCTAGVDCPTAVTDSDGKYIFSGLAPSDYTVAVVTSTLPAGLAATYDKDGDKNSQTPVTLAAGQVIEDIDFGYKWSGTGGVIGDRIWNDANGDGVQDPGEPGIGGVTVTLSDGTNTWTTTTAPDGSYSFPNLPPGNYTVTATPPTGTTLTGDPDQPGSTCSICDSKTTTPITITAAGEVIMTADFGFQYPENTTSDLGDLIWLDKDSDGIQDADELGIEGVTVVLKDNGGVIIATTVTDANGNYLFPDLPPGTYTVTVTDTAGKLTDLIQTFDPDGSVNNSHTVTIIGGTDYLDADFGYGAPKPTYAAVSGFAAYVDEGGGVVLEWRTAGEIGTVGFVLERLNREGGGYEPVSPDMLPGVLDPPRGGVYRLADPGASPGQEQTYQVVEIDAQGRGMVSGPHTVKAELPLPPSAPGMTRRLEGFSSARQAMGRGDALRSAARKAALRSAAAAPKKPQAAVRTLKVPVSRDGLVWLTADGLAAASGMRRNQIVPLLKARKVLVTLEGRRIPVLPAVNGGGLWFYGQGPVRKDLTANIYRLELGKTGAALASAPARPAGFSGKSFTDLIRLEENRRPLHFYNIGRPLSDLWAWTYLYASGGKPGSFTLTADAPHLADGPAVLTAHLVNTGFRRGGGSAAPYSTALFLNGVEIGAAESWEQGDWRVRAEIPHGLLRESGNEVKITALLNPGIVYSLIHLESVEIERQRGWQADGGELAFRSGGGSVTVEGFSGKTVLALDITDPEKPQRVKAAVRKKNAGGLHAVTVQTRPARRYFITENLGATVSGSLEPDIPSQLRSVRNQADYVIVTSAGLLDTARRLAGHREGQGLKTMLVDIEDVRDEFSWSQAAPEAVRTFLTYARARWTQPPRYVALIGDGSFDYRNHLGHGAPQLPAELVMTPDGVFPSDNALGDVAGEDGVPEFAAGRIPSFDNEELARYIDKIIAYEQQQPAAAAVAVSDRPDPAAGDFKASADKAAALMPEHMDVLRLDVASAAKYAEARNKILGAMQSGASVVHYVGHSSMAALGAGSALLQAAAVDALNPAGQPLLMVSMSCSAGFFGYPALNSFGETALLKADGGAAAFFGASGLSYNHLADIMAEGFYKGLADPAGNPRIGDAVIHAKRHYAEARKDSDTFMLDIYNLLGDPALLTPARP
ncbi:SdrD B-like domain-containing protein [Candidatus Electronema sp. TJ]|uniref:SdrD B-like domain-containing protein n=1 Tax=Candidatus Electronema sp. TJ TaxID=3401573 RepID=UPI003AA85AEB